VARDGFFWSLETQADVLPESDTLGGLGSQEFLGVVENGVLLLEGLLLLKRKRREKRKG
jgi:hypothetical protein